MITASELRVGNALMVTATDTMDNHISFVVSISKDEIRVSRDDDYGMGCDLDGLLPIPLTPEILEKCGFEKSKNHSLDYFKKSVTGNAFFFRIGRPFKHENRFYPEVKYLHQIQNLYFALTGDELPVVNLMSESKNSINVHS